MTDYVSSIQNHYPNERAFFQAYRDIRVKLNVDNYLELMPIGIGDFLFSYVWYYRRDGQNTTEFSKALNAIKADVMSFNQILQALSINQRIAMLIAAHRLDAVTEDYTFRRYAAAITVRLYENGMNELIHELDQYGDAESMVEDYVQRDNLLKMVDHLNLVQELSKGKPIEPAPDAIVVVNRLAMQLPININGMRDKIDRAREQILDVAEMARGQIIGRDEPLAVKFFLDPQTYSNIVQLPRPK